MAISKANRRMGCIEKNAGSIGILKLSAISLRLKLREVKLIPWINYESRNRNRERFIMRILLLVL